MSTILVTGLPRSGLTLTMQMLHAGGFDCVGTMPAFEPYGIGQIPWAKCDGKAVKLINAHSQLPPPGDYDVIRLRRDLRQQARSNNKFGKVFGIPKVPTAKLVLSLKRSYRAIDDWAIRQRRCWFLEFENLITDPRICASILSSFVGGLDKEKAASVVIKRSPKCGPELHEFGMV